MDNTIANIQSESPYIFSNNIPKEVQAYYNKCIEKEPAISSALSDVTSQTGGFFVDTQDSIKTVSSIEEKILDREIKMEENGNLGNATTLDFVRSFTDLIRYTQILPKETIATAIPDIKENVEEKGFIVIKTQDFFSNPKETTHYKGFHIDLIAPSGVKVELQIHTKESFDAKMLGHKDYEIMRNPTDKYSIEEKEEAKERMIVINDQIPDVPGLSKMEDYKMEKENIEKICDKLETEYDIKMEILEDDPYETEEYENDIDIDYDDVDYYDDDSVD